jgi:hypothetical protein
MPHLSELALAFALTMPEGMMSQRQWFGVRDTYIWNIQGYGVKVSHWCNGQTFISPGYCGNLWRTWRVW